MEGLWPRVGDEQGQGERDPAVRWWWRRARWRSRWPGLKERWIAGLDDQLLACGERTAQLDGDQAPGLAGHHAQHDLVPVVLVHQVEAVLGPGSLRSCRADLLEVDDTGVVLGQLREVEAIRPDDVGWGGDALVHMGRQGWHGAPLRWSSAAQRWAVRGQRSVVRGSGR